MFEGMYAMIENTTACGGNCVMCPRDLFSHRIEHMSIEIYKKIIDELVEKGCRKIGIIGFGDSLCDNGLEEKLQYTRSICPDMFISTINTGHMLNEKKRVMVSKYFNMIKISMYGFTKKTYESIHRGSLIFENVKENIDSFLETRGSCYTIMTYLVMDNNKNEVEQWKDYYEPRCDRIDIWKPHNWGGGFETSDSPILMPCPRVLNCNDIQFCTDGTVVTCCFDFNRHDVIGNVNNSTIEEILNGGAIKRMKDIHINGLVMKSNLTCKFCDQIRDRSDALIYSSDKSMKVGKSSMVNYEQTHESK